LVDFTDEEGYGKYLDLHESYVKYTNLKGIQVEYLKKNRLNDKKKNN
jgi:splicing factor 3A subunit 3